MILLGASGHGKVIADILKLSGEREIIFWDDDPAAAVPGYIVCSPQKYTEDEVILSIGNNATRKKIADASSYTYGKAIHPTAILSTDVFISLGTVVMAASVINPGSRIGKHCIINTAAVIDHDVIIEDYVHISPNATLAGNVTVKEGVWVGAGVTIIQGITIGSWAVIGAGAVVIKDVPDNAVVVGNPAKIIRYFSENKNLIRLEKIISMTHPKIWLSSPHMGGKEQEYVKEAFDTNWVAPLGPNVNGFETDLSSYLGEGVHAAALSSGTAAIHLALILLGIQRGDEVICQSMTFSASANPIAYLGANPIFIDSEMDTWNMSPAFLEEAILNRIANGKKPKAIIVVHLYGMPAKMEEIAAVANKYEIPLIEDAAEALGSSINGIKCGTFGDVSILSFNGNKIITTSGGGAFISKNLDWVKKATFLSTQARDTAPHYQHSQIGYNYRMSNICAGIGRGQMQVLDERVAQRRSNYEFYKQQFDSIDWITFPEEPQGFFSNRWLTTILVDPLKAGFDREKIQIVLEKENIESRPLWKPMHLQPVFKDFPYYGAKVCENLFTNGLCLPSGSNLKIEDLERICRSIKNIRAY